MRKEEVALRESAVAIGYFSWQLGPDADRRQALSEGGPDEMGSALAKVMSKQPLLLELSYLCTGSQPCLGLSGRALSAPHEQHDVADFFSHTIESCTPRITQGRWEARVQEGAAIAH